MTDRFGSPVLVFLGVLLSSWPLVDLFDRPLWLPPLLATMAAVAIAGMIGRALSRSRWPVVLVQLLVLVAALLLLFAGSTLRLGVLPTPATVTHLIALVDDAVRTIRTSPPPAPASPGVVMLLTAALAGIHLCCDVVATTLRRPALAGLGLLMPLLTAVANSDGSLPSAFFVLTAISWLALLAVQDRADLQAWIPGRRLGADGERGTVALMLGAGAIALALVVASALPHAPARYLADGLGRDGIGRTGVGYSPSADMLRDLESKDDTPVLTYRTDDPAPPPLRAGVAERYWEGRWYPQDAPDARPDPPTLRYPDVAQDVPRVARSLEVEQTRLQAPFLATPQRLTTLSVKGADWVDTPSLEVVSVDRTPRSYSLSYLDIDPSPAQLTVGGGPNTPSPSTTLATSAITPFVAQTARAITRDAEGDFAKAVALQNWFRDDGGFTYSLRLEPRPAGMNDEEAASGAVDRFLETKRGYCVQFATAMVLMSRELGIPARAVTGFLPGRQDGERREVRATDAHMWPELYFDDVGWLRFEPTPGTRSGSVPPYAAQAQPGGGAASPTATPTTASPAPSASASAGADPRRPELDTDTGGPLATGADTGGGAARLLVPALLMAALAAGALVLPLAGRRQRRRERDIAVADGCAADAVEVHWGQLLEKAADLGISVDPSATLSRQHRDLTLSTLFDPDHDAALGRITSAVERARYARDPRVDLTALDADIAVVGRALCRSRRRRERIVAWLWPTSGRRAVGARWDRVRGRRHRRDDEPIAAVRAREDSSSGGG